MPFLKLTFRQNLLVLIALIIVGFTVLVGLSMSALSTQNKAAEHVDEISEQLIVLGNLKARVALISSGDKNSVISELTSVLDEQRESLSRISSNGDTDQVLNNLNLWADLWTQEHGLRSVIGLTAQEGLRGQLNRILTTLEKRNFSNTRPKFQAYMKAVSVMVDLRSEPSIHKASTLLKDYRDYLEEIGFLKPFAKDLAKIETLHKKLVEEMRKHQALITQERDTLGQVHSLTDELMDKRLVDLAGAREASVEASAFAQWIIIVAGVGVAGVAGVLLVGIWVSTTRDLGDIVKA